MARPTRTTTTRRRRGRNGQRDPGPDPATHQTAGRQQADGFPRQSTVDEEHHGGHSIDEDGQGGPQTAGAQDRVGKGQPQDRQQHDAQAGPEVPPIDRGGEGASDHEDGARPWRSVLGTAQSPQQQRLESEQDGPAEHQPGSQGAEEGR